MTFSKIKATQNSTLYFGSAPGYPNFEASEIFKDIRQLRSLDIKTLVCLLPHYDIEKGPLWINLFEEYKEMLPNLSVINFPIDDYAIPPGGFKRFDAFITQIGLALKDGGNVYVHCNAGLGRTGMVIAAILIRYGKTPVLRAIATIRQLRWGAIETAGQEGYLKRYEMYVNSIRSAS